jgi:hypothetical protein
MLAVKDLSQAIAALDPNQDTARLCLFNYLENLCEPEEPLSPELFNRFFYRALTFAQWRENQNRLFEEVNWLLLHFFESHAPSWDWERVIHADQLQAFEVKSPRNLEALVRGFLESQLKPEDRFRVFTQTEPVLSAVAVILRSDGSLKIFTIPALGALIEGEAFPLCTDFSLHYESDLSLSTHHIQQLDVGPSGGGGIGSSAITVARFRQHEGGHCTGALIRGYTFQKYAVIDGGALHRYPLVFYPLKRLEQYFINRKTDPMYLELTGMLEKASQLIHADHPEALSYASAALDRGRLLLENIFPEDQMGRLLINNLERILASPSSNGRMASASSASSSALGAALNNSTSQTSTIIESEKR